MVLENILDVFKKNPVSWVSCSLLVKPDFVNEPILWQRWDTMPPETTSSLLLKHACTKDNMITSLVRLDYAHQPHM